MNKKRENKIDSHYQRHVKSDKVLNRLGSNKDHPNVRQVYHSLGLNMTSMSSVSNTHRTTSTNTVSIGAKQKRRKDEPRNLVDFKLNPISDKNKHLINKGNRHPIRHQLRVKRH